MLKRKLKVGMIGGGINAFIGNIHRIAFNMDGLVELVAGVFSTQPSINQQSAEQYFVPQHRTYNSYTEMLEKESLLPDNERIDFVTIVTPNFAHFEPAMMALKKGFHVVIDKPITFNLEQALILKKTVEQTGLILCLTHTYAGYPMVKQARAMCADNLLGEVRKIWVEYPQGWLAQLPEKQGNPQALWRTDPTKTGKSGCMGDIGTHAAHLAEYITQLEITQLCAHLTTKTPERKLDDDGNILLQFNNGANGVLMASQVAEGEENNLKIRVYGEKASLEWCQADANSLYFKRNNQPLQILKAGSNYPYLSTAARHNCRTPGGHPEGYLEAFANLYKNFALTLLTQMNHQTPTPEMLDFPSINEGIRGMSFIDNVVASSVSTQKWYPNHLPITQL